MLGFENSSSSSIGNIFLLVTSASTPIVGINLEMPITSQYVVEQNLDYEYPKLDNSFCEYSVEEFGNEIIFSFIEKVITNSTSVDNEFLEVVNSDFWELI